MQRLSVCVRHHTYMSIAFSQKSVFLLFGFFICHSGVLIVPCTDHSDGGRRHGVQPSKPAAWHGLQQRQPEHQCLRRRRRSQLPLLTWFQEWMVWLCIQYEMKLWSLQNDDLHTLVILFSTTGWLSRLRGHRRESCPTSDWTITTHNSKVLPTIVFEVNT